MTNYSQRILTYRTCILLLVVKYVYHAYFITGPNVRSHYGTTQSGNAVHGWVTVAARDPNTSSLGITWTTIMTTYLSGRRSCTRGTCVHPTSSDPRWCYRRWTGSLSEQHTAPWTPSGTRNGRSDPTTTHTRTHTEHREHHQERETVD